MSNSFRPKDCSPPWSISIVKNRYKWRGWWSTLDQCVFLVFRFCLLHPVVSCTFSALKCYGYFSFPFPSLTFSFSFLPPSLPFLLHFFFFPFMFGISHWKQDWELTVAQIMNSLLKNPDLNLKKEGETTRPFRYDLNQIPYGYTLEVTNSQGIRSDRQSAWRTMDRGS